MVSRRIKLIASLLCKDDKVLDVGTDHALLPIYLNKNNMVSFVAASDISKTVLVKAHENLVKYNMLDKIPLLLSDGLKDIDSSMFNTLVICGMGFYTIRDILSNADLKTINKMVIQSNNHYDDLRKYIISHGYKIDNEHWICDQNIDYIIFEVSKGDQKLTNEEILCGIYNPENYSFYLKELDKYHSILKKVPSKFNSKIIDIYHIIDIYESYVSKYKTEEKSN